jgi:uncharacterized protein involved in tolerance to divalent cations
MILLRIRTDTETRREEIARFLLKENLAIDLNFKESIDLLSLNDVGELVSTRKYVLSGKTKALLFHDIEARLREKYGNDMPEFYCLPIAHMDWDHARLLLDKIKRV